MHNHITMKKQITLLAGMALLAACGPGAKEKAAQAVRDSIATAQQAEADSLAAIAAHDSVNAIMEQMRLDSIAMADSLAMLQGKLKTAKAKPVQKPQPVKETPKKQGLKGLGEKVQSDTTKKQGLRGLAK
jgi:hypothetical protein